MGTILAILMIIALIWIALKVTKFLVQLVFFVIAFSLLAMAWFFWIEMTT